MSARTKARHTDNAKPRQLRVPKAFALGKVQDEGVTPWRELFLDLLNKQTEQGLYLAGLRCRESLTQKQLAEHLEIRRARISRIEKGLHSISVKTTKKLAALFRVPYKGFMTKANLI